MRIKFVWPSEITYSTGPLSGPVQPDEEREVSDEQGQLLVDSGFWTQAEEKQPAPKAKKAGKSAEEVQSQQ